MDAVGAVVSAAIDLCKHAKTSHARHKASSKDRWRLLCTVAVFVVILTSIVIYGVYVTMRSVESYRNTVYEGKVHSAQTLHFPATYVCSIERGVHALGHSKCVIDEDWSFDMETFWTESGSNCTVGAAQIPAADVTGKSRFRNWTCTVFNSDGSAIASADSEGLTTMHIAYEGLYSKPLMVMLVDPSQQNGRRFKAGPDFVFSAQTEAYVLMRKTITNDVDGNVDVVDYETTVSSSALTVTPSHGLGYSYIGLSFATFEVDEYDRVVQYTWTDALAAFGGATCLARLLLFCVPSPQPISEDDDDAGVVPYGGGAATSARQRKLGTNGSPDRKSVV